MKEPKFTRHKVTILKGAIGDMGREWMTDKDWEEHDKYVEELKASGEYLQPEEVIIDMIDSPFHDDRSYTSAPLESASMTFLDFGKTEFHGINYTLQDGSTEIVTPHPEVKEEVESYMGKLWKNKRKKIALDQERSKGTIYVGAVTGMLRRFIGTDHLYGDGWSLHVKQDLTDKEINDHNRPTLEADFKTTGLPEIYRSMYVNDDWGKGK